MPPYWRLYLTKMQTVSKYAIGCGALALPSSRFSGWSLLCTSCGDWESPKMWIRMEESRPMFFQWPRKCTECTMRYAYGRITVKDCGSELGRLKTWAWRPQRTVLSMEIMLQMPKSPNICPRIGGSRCRVMLIWYQDEWYFQPVVTGTAWPTEERLPR